MSPTVVGVDTFSDASIISKRKVRELGKEDQIKEGCVRLRFANGSVCYTQGVVKLRWLLIDGLTPHDHEFHVLETDEFEAIFSRAYADELNITDWNWQRVKIIVRDRKKRRCQLL